MSVATLPDHVDLLRDALAASGVAASVTGGSVPAGVSSVVRAYAETLPSSPILLTSGGPSAIAPALVIATAGGLPNPTLPFMAGARVELRAYAATRVQARLLWIAAMRALADARTRHATGWIECGRALPSYVGPEAGTGFVAAIGMIPLTMIGR